MFNWELYVYKNCYNLSGTADDHPSLGRNTYISQTSTVVCYELKDDVLTYETQNTIYVCALKYINTKPYGNVVPKYKKELTHRADESDNCLDIIITALAKMATDNSLDDEFVCHILELAEIGKKEMQEREEAQNRALFEIVKDYENCIYIEVSNIEEGDKLVYHIGDDFGTIMPQLHSGMFQDSVLYRDYEDNNRLDFRYFPDIFGVSMRTYSWSDNIQLAVIKNCKQMPITFNGTSIKPGEVESFKYPEVPDNDSAEEPDTDNLM